MTNRTTNQSVIADARVTINGESTYLDINITSPTGAKNMADNPTLIGGRPATRCEDRKRAKYSSVLGHHILEHFRPIVIETTGRLGTSASSYIDQLSEAARALNSASDLAIQQARRKLAQRISIIMCNGNARQITSCRSCVLTFADLPGFLPVPRPSRFDDSDDEDLPPPDPELDLTAPAPVAAPVEPPIRNRL